MQRQLAFRVVICDCQVQRRRCSVLPDLESILPNNQTIFIPFVPAVTRDDKSRAAVPEPFNGSGVYLKSHSQRSRSRTMHLNSNGALINSDLEAQFEVLEFTAGHGQH